MPPLTPEQLESKAERFTGVFIPLRRGDHSRRRRGRYDDGTDGGDARVLTPPTVGANASLATRVGRCRTATPSESADEDGDGEEDGNGGKRLNMRQPRWDDGEGGEGFAPEPSAEAPLGSSNSSSATTTASTKFLANATLVSSLSSATSRVSSGKGVAARIAAAQERASSNISTINGNNNINGSSSSSRSPSDNAHAKAAATNTSSSDSIPPPFQGRSLMSAQWVSKRGDGAAGRRGHSRFATKGLTPGSWTATEDPNPEGETGVTTGQGVGGGGSGGGDGGFVGLRSGAGYVSSQHRGGGVAEPRRRRAGEVVQKRGLGRGWEGLYQVRSFEDTPE